MYVYIRSEPGLVADKRSKSPMILTASGYQIGVARTAAEFESIEPNRRQGIGGADAAGER